MPPVTTYAAEEGDPGEWLPCDEWTGPGSKLPRGCWSPIPGFLPYKYAYRWKVMKPEDQTVREVKAAEIEEDDEIVGVILNETMIKELAETYGQEDYVFIKDANTNQEYTRLQWRAKYGTDGLALCAIRDKRMKLKKPIQIGMIGK